MKRGGSSIAAVTILELVTAIAILAVLATMLLSATDGVRTRVEQVGCYANMRSLTTALHLYLQDHERVWPQIPPDADEEQRARMWIAYLKPYGPPKETWLCPTLKRLILETPEYFEKTPPIHYIPAQYNPIPGTAFKWPKMPWIIEAGGFHGKGNLIGYQDGSIRPFEDVLKEATP